jgi:hypothetical protein
MKKIFVCALFLIAAPILAMNYADENQAPEPEDNRIDELLQPQVAIARPDRARRRHRADVRIVREVPQPHPADIAAPLVQDNAPGAPLNLPAQPVQIVYAAAQRYYLDRELQLNNDQVRAPQAHANLIYLRGRLFH